MTTSNKGASGQLVKALARQGVTTRRALLIMQDAYADDDEGDAMALAITTLALAYMDAGKAGTISKGAAARAVRDAAREVRREFSAMERRALDMPLSVCVR